MILQQKLGNEYHCSGERILHLRLELLEDQDQFIFGVLRFQITQKEQVMEQDQI
jgi:hypothetical protein